MSLKQKIMNVINMDGLEKAKGCLSIKQDLKEGGSEYQKH
jgi:hypothetical protein